VKKILILILLLIVFNAAIYSTRQNLNHGTKGETMKIKMTIENKIITATLYDNPTSRDFISLLPIALTFKDYAGTEKISDLPKRLSLEGAPSGSDPSVGDITYYSPWGNLALFYKDFGYASGLIILGKIDSGIEIFKSYRQPFKVKIELYN